MKKLLFLFLTVLFLYSCEEPMAPTIEATLPSHIVDYGDSTTFYWHAEGEISYVTLDRKIVSNPGFFTTPKLYINTDYILAVAGPGGYTSKTVTIVVDSARVPEIRITLISDTIPYGFYTSFSWSTKGLISSVTLDNKAVTSSGSFTTPKLFEDKDFILVFNCPSGIFTKTISIKVEKPIIISAHACLNGSITPFWDVYVLKNTDQLFTITPKPFFEVENVFIDDQPVGPLNSYKFSDVTTNHKIDVTFKRDTLLWLLQNIFWKDANMDIIDDITFFGGFDVVYWFKSDGTLFESYNGSPYFLRDTWTLNKNVSPPILRFNATNYELQINEKLMTLTYLQYQGHIISMIFTNYKNKN